MSELDTNADQKSVLRSLGGNPLSPLASERWLEMDWEVSLPTLACVSRSTRHRYHPLASLPVTLTLSPCRNMDQDAPGTSQWSCRSSVRTSAQEVMEVQLVTTSGIVHIHKWSVIETEQSN